MELYIKSDNDASNLTAAEWLLKGNHVPRDVDRALEIVYKLSEKEIAQYGSFENAIKLRTDFSNSPIFILNEWYTCKKLITLEQLGKYRLEWFTYAGYCDECQSCL